MAEPKATTQLETLSSCRGSLTRPKSCPCCYLPLLYVTKWELKNGIDNGAMGTGQPRRILLWTIPPPPLPPSLELQRAEIIFARDICLYDNDDKPAAVEKYPESYRISWIYFKP